MTKDVTLDKARMRKQMLSARRALSKSEVQQSSQRIAAHVIALPEWSAASTVLTYIAAGNNEVDTHALLASAWEMGKAVAAPRVTGPGTMEWAPMGSMDDLVPGAYGILEPKAESITLPFQLDAIVLVPGVAYTRAGHRLGQGGGYFDRFLENFPGTSIGLAHDGQLVGEIPNDEWDIPVGMVVTASGVYPVSP